MPSILQRLGVAGDTDNDVILEVAGYALAGWEGLTVTRHAEAFPNSFQVGLSALDPASGVRIEALPGQPCSLRIGGDLILTGYIDSAGNGAGASAHGLSISGRGKTADLVDCSAELPSGALNASNTLSLAQQAAQPYGIAVRQLGSVAADEHIPSFLLSYGETGADLIQRTARNASLLAYEDTDGALLLAPVGALQAASGAIYGENVEQWSCDQSWAERYSEIVCVAGPLDQLQDVKGPDALSEAKGFVFYTATDPELIAAKRHRRLYMSVEQAADPMQFCTNKAKWEMSRRIGRSVIVRATVDSWRDSAGALWAPNTLVPVDGPGFRLVDKILVLAEVTFRKDEAGTHADMTLLPKAAFAPEPISLLQANQSDVRGPSTNLR